jgi:hypothetical protein
VFGRLSRHGWPESGQRAVWVVGREFVGDGVVDEGMVWFLKRRNAPRPWSAPAKVSTLHRR